LPYLEPAELLRGLIVKLYLKNLIEVAETNRIGALAINEWSEKP
jgi:hypothetical protein